MLPLDIQIELFDRMIVPILLYGCEVWCPSMLNLASKLQLRYYKMILKLNKATPTKMIYGELGQFPLEVQAKTRMLNFWFKLVTNSNLNKFSCIMYRFLHDMYYNSDYKSNYLVTVESLLTDLGLSGMWINQFELSCSDHWFKQKVNRSLKDQYIQQWLSDIDTGDIFYNYRLYKGVFQTESFLSCLPQPLILSILHFRTLNHRLPIQKGRINNIPRGERLCHLCDDNDVGDEFHYIFDCAFFSNSRNALIPRYYRFRPNVLKFQELFSTKSRKLLIKLAKFCNIIMKNV